MSEPVRVINQNGVPILSGNQTLEQFKAHIVAVVTGEADSLDDYANEVSSEMTEAVLRGSAKRLREGLTK